ncbi:carbohydrate ABC transporter permease, partial [Clostridium perfringens]|uniref:carbohydrate ABC transporter permease n=1 Tax=Clostridium perfringens TaxID=1502 RepID=UPI0024BD0D61
MLETIKQKRLQKKAEPKEEVNKFNAVSKKSNFLLNVLFAILAFLAIMPFVFVIAISLTNEQSLQLNGYRFIPEEWSLEAYKYIFSSGSQILTSYGVTITVTIVGTLIGLAIMSMYGYALSRKSFAYRKFFTKVIFVPMLFSGGMVASYLVVTRFLGLKNTIWALILPMCVSSFHIIILRTFFKTSVPDAIIESAKIDGASEWRLFLIIVLPISLPGIATIGLFLTLGYWNDWF